MDKVSCKECNKEFLDAKGLHLHLKSHRMTAHDYYHAHYPRYDLVSNDFIEFKNKDQYFSTFFNSHDTFCEFFESGSKISQQQFIKDFLLCRKHFKETRVAPCQVELRTIKLAPNIIHFKRAFLSNKYYQYCLDLGFEVRFKDFDNVKLHYEMLNEMKVQIDTREQKPLNFKAIQHHFDKLDYGDYKFYNDNGYEVYFERKSLSDLISTVTLGDERFRNELLRAKEKGSYVVVVVESSINDLLNFNNLKWIYSKHKIIPEYVCHNIRTLIQDFDNLQFLFIPSRIEAIKIMSNIFCTAGKYKAIDLQLASDLSLL